MALRLVVVAYCIVTISSAAIATAQSLTIVNLDSSIATVSFNSGLKCSSQTYPASCNCRLFGDAEWSSPSPGARHSWRQRAWLDSEQTIDFSVRGISLGTTFIGITAYAGPPCGVGSGNCAPSDRDGVRALVRP